MIRLCLILAAAVVFWIGGAEARPFTDSAGRRVELPDTVRRVMTAGPPASVAVYALAPDKLLGWVRAFTPAERPYIAPRYVDLPETGRLTGRGNTASMEAVVALRPDVIVDVGVIDATYVSLADRVQRQTGIPYVLIDGTFARTADSFRLLGAALGAEERAALLAAYAERTIGDLRRALPGGDRPRVYYGRGPKGLETGRAGSINMEVLELVGAVNVAAAADKGGLTTVSLEQILAWNPDVILTQDAIFHASVRRDPLWQGVRAVREGRVVRVPDVPWGWYDTPPGANRLIGVHWLAAVLYPGVAGTGLRAATRDFYKTFYHVELSDAQLDHLLKDAVAQPR